MIVIFNKKNRICEFLPNNICASFLSNDIKIGFLSKNLKREAQIYLSNSLFSKQCLLIIRKCKNVHLSYATQLHVKWFKN